jgi:hypothetical protein
MIKIIRWWTYVLVYYARKFWNDLPGPWPVKVALLAVTQLIPGVLDEIALVALTSIWRRWKLRQATVREAT